jgi:ubiquinone/menaquinone biosynthesis C-methylase UbiE
VISSAKSEIRKQWDADPCGASTAPGEQPGTRAFYEQVRRYRYGVYAPWLGQLLESAATPKKRILEIGVGLGSDHYRFAAAGNSMIALDLSREHLRQTARHLELDGLSTRPVYGDAESMAFPGASFDMVYAFGAIHHTPSPQSAVKEIYRVLKPGGVALVAVYHVNSLNFLGFVVRHGLLRGRLFKKGWSEFLSEIEYRKDPDSAAPLVKLFSRRQARQLFGAFLNVEISTHHVEFPSLHQKWPNSRTSLERLGRLFGWYVFVRAEK